MKVTDWRRKLAASLVAGGMMAPTAVRAANLDTNLLLNPGFESVSFTSVGGYGGPSILDWTAGTRQGFAYSHNLSNGIPDYANGRPLSGGGNWYFTSNSGLDGSTTDDADAPGKVAQVVDVTAGATAAQIASGEAVVNLSGFFSGYLNNGDYGHLHVEFLNAGNASLGTTEITNINDTSTWRSKSSTAPVPVGTASLRVSVFGTPLSGGPDGYIDNVDVRVKTAASELVFLEVNTTNGQVKIKNQTGAAVKVDYYQITSAASALNAVGWSSFQDQNQAGFPAGNGTGNGWEEAGGSGAKVLGESYLTGNSAVANSASLGLGAAFNVGGAHDLVFKYGALVGVAGDYNGNGVVDAADYTVWRDHLGQSFTMSNDITRGVVDQADYDVWRANFGQTAGPTDPSTLVTGFVRYVTSGATAAVPEPSSVVLVGVGLATLAVGCRSLNREPAV
jgi:hypothetical protein